MKTQASHEKTETILTMLAQGHTREEIGEHYNQPWKSIDMHMRRRGYIWSKEEATYITKPVEEAPATQEDILLEQTKAAKIARQFQVKYPNARQIAQQNGFNSSVEMGTYMEKEGYIWNDQTNAYEKEVVEVIPSPASVPAEQVTSIKNETTFLTKDALVDFLLENQQLLQKAITSQTVSGTLPSYVFKGGSSNKTVSLANALKVLIVDYSSEYNLSQRKVVEMALGDFFLKYGYEQRMKNILS